MATRRAKDGVQSAILCSYTLKNPQAKNANYTVLFALYSLFRIELLLNSNNLNLIPQWNICLHLAHEPDGSTREGYLDGKLDIAPGSVLVCL